MRKVKARRARRAFSLLELTLVLAIIGVLMAVAAVNVLGTGKRANVRATEASLRTVGEAIDRYFMDNSSTYPPTLQTLVTAQYVKDGAQRDAWKVDFWYSAVGSTTGNPYVLSSAGPDKQYGTEDDINYWMLGN